MLVVGLKQTISRLRIIQLANLVGAIPCAHLWSSGQARVIHGFCLGINLSLVLLAEIMIHEKRTTAFWMAEALRGAIGGRILQKAKVVFEASARIERARPERN